MSKHYRFEHTCGHIGIGPLIRTHNPPGEINEPSAPTSQTLESINLALSIRCPFCANTQPYLNVAAGDGLLAILEPTSLTIPSNTFEWRVLRVCPASEITSSDWYLSHAPGQHYRQMAWIPKPCGTVRIHGSGAEEVRIWNGMRRQVDCSWRQSRQGFESPDYGVKSRLPGMWSSLSASLMSVEQDREA